MIFTYTPIFHRLFHTDQIPADAWLRVLAVGVASFIIIEVVKGIETALDKRSSWRNNTAGEK